MTIGIHNLKVVKHTSLYILVGIAGPFANGVITVASGDTRISDALEVGRDSFCTSGYEPECNKKFSVYIVK
jgi:hypothetical protein